MTHTSSQRYYQVVLIWLKDPPKFQRYLELAAPIVGRYGGALERMITPESVYPQSVPKPTIVNVVYYDDRNAFAQLANDPDFQRIVHLRTESVDMAAVNGAALDGELVDTAGVGQRHYLVELAQFGVGGMAAYRDYEHESLPVLAEYGHRLERVIRADSASGLSFQPDVAKVTYFSDGDAMARLHADPRHEALERSYPAATGDSLWIFGRAGVVAH